MTRVDNTEPIRLELPSEVVDELVKEGGFVRAVSMRGPAMETLTYGLTAANISASAVALSQAPDAIRRSLRAVKRWTGRTSASCEIVIRGPEGEVNVTFEPGANPDLEALLSSVGLGPSQE